MANQITYFGLFTSLSPHLSHVDPTGLLFCRFQSPRPSHGSIRMTSKNGFVYRGAMPFSTGFQIEAGSVNFHANGPSIFSFVGSIIAGSGSIFGPITAHAIKPAILVEPYVPMAINSFETIV